MHNFSDEGNGCCSPISNFPTLQFFCGEEFFQHRLPFGRSPLTRRLASSRFGTASRTWKLLSSDIGADLEIDTASSSAPSVSSSLAHHLMPPRWGALRAYGVRRADASAWRKAGEPCGGHKGRSGQAADFRQVIVDTTVEEKAVTFPTDAKLMHRAGERLVKPRNMAWPCASPVPGWASSP